MTGREGEMKMKKWIGLLLCLVMLLGLTAAGEVKVDLSAYSNDEIVELLQLVQQEIAVRKIEKTASLAAGRYIAGVDLPCGTYVYKSKAVGSDWGSVTVYSEKGNGKQLLWEIVDADDEPFMVTLSPNDELKSAVPFELTIFAGVMFR